MKLLENAVGEENFSGRDGLGGFFSFQRQIAGTHQLQTEKTLEHFSIVRLQEPAFRSASLTQ